MRLHQVCDHAGVHLPFAPLEDLLVARLNGRRVLVPGDDNNDGTLVAVPVLAARCGVSARTWQRWRKAGRLPWDAADQVAISIDEHPLLIWPEFHDILDPTPCG
jgi:hypothetical protein